MTTEDAAKLEAWIDEQIQGIRRSSLVESSVGALAAFERTKIKLHELTDAERSQSEVEFDSDGLDYR